MDSRGCRPGRSIVKDPFFRGAMRRSSIIVLLVVSVLGVGWYAWWSCGRRRATGRPEATDGPIVAIGHDSGDDAGPAGGGGIPRGAGPADIVDDATGGGPAGAAGGLPDAADGPADGSSVESAFGRVDRLAVCSFNIQFLGHFRRKDCDTLARILADYDIVLVQELVAPPVAGTYPDGQPYTADPEAAAFFAAMEAEGFSWHLAPEDTGTNETIHTAGPATEWPVAFYRASAVRWAPDLPVGYLAEDRSDHVDYERVPYAFGFRSSSRTLDFVLISVHLNPGSSGSNQARRAHELAAISRWIDAHDEVEKDFIIAGDMNIEDADELGEVLPAGWVSLNDECRPTNTNPRAPKPYDHVVFNPITTTEMDVQSDLVVIDLIEAVRPFWAQPDEPFPGEPYDHNRFRQIYSDHHPVVFGLMVPDADDD